MEFRILGPLEVVADGATLDVGGPKQRTLLAALLLEANRVVSCDRLIDALWEEAPPEKAQKALHVYVSQLRKLLGSERLETKAPGYLLRVEPDELDLERFERLHDEERFHEALALWRGPPLADFAYHRFAAADIERLEERRLACLEERIERDLAAGQHAQLVGELEALVKEHPLRERPRLQLMLALYRSGRQAEALELYQDARRALVEELGIEPGRALRELHQAILRQDPELELAPAEPPVETARGAFVGREAELAELVGSLDDAFAGRGRLFLLAGEPGIGKSRLAEELMAHARARGARVLVGRSWEAGGAPAYWPWLQALRAYVRETDDAALRSQLAAGAADLAQILPELRQRFPELPEPPAVESEGARFRLFEATANLLQNASERRPIVLVLDDLHAADAPSLLLLQFLARDLGSTRILVVGSYRDAHPTPGPALAELLAEVAREPVTRRLSLGGLSERELAEYVEVTEAEVASPELAAMLHEQTEGNPLFVGEMVRLLAMEGLRPQSTGGKIGIPQSIRDVIARRLTHVSDECNRVLVLASILGREFALEALARLSGVSQDDLLETLDEAMAARLVSEVPGAPGRLGFAHVLIRDTLYEGLTTARRVRLHRQAIGALEELYGDEAGPHLAELAPHAIAGSDFEKGFRYGRRAGDRALALLAYEEAARLYQTALEALELSTPSDETARCELLLLLGEAELRAGDSLAAKAAFLEAAASARRIARPRELARAAAGYGGVFMDARAGGDDRLVPLLEEGLVSLGDDDVELRARLLARLAGALRDEPARDRRDALSREALELARRSGDPTALAYALDGRAAAIMAPDTTVECFQLGSELCEVGERINDPERVLQGYWHRVTANLLVGEVGDAESDLRAMQRTAEGLRQPVQLWQVYAGQAMLALAAGNFSEAEELIPKAGALGERAQPEMAIPVHRLQRYTLCDFRDTLEQVEPAIRALVVEYPARPVFRCALVYLHARLGRLADAQRAFDELAEDEFSALPFDLEWLYGMSLLAETCTFLGDSRAADVLYRLLLPWASFNAVDAAEAIRGSVARYLGLLAAAVSRWDDGARHFEDALAMNAKMGARPWLAYTQDDYARLLHARGRRGDRERAEELRGAALATYGEIGIEPQRERSLAVTAAGTPVA